MKTKTVQRINIKTLKYKVKQDEHVDKMKLNKRFSKMIQIDENLNEIRAKDNIARLKSAIIKIELF